MNPTPHRPLFDDWFLRWLDRWLRCAERPQRHVPYC